MKAAILVACFVAAASGAFAAPGCGPRVQPPVPWFRHEAAHPLLRYLIATLHLPDGQALAVQRALKTHALGTPTAAELAALLLPVLTEAQFTKFQDLQDSEMLGSDLHYLASLH